MYDDEYWDQIDEIELTLPDRASKITALDRLIAAATPGTQEWGDLIVAASDHRLFTGDAETALVHLEMVRDAGVVLSPSIDATLLCAHLTAGDRAQVEKIDGELRRRSRDIDLGQDYTMVAEAYEEAGMLKAALRWFSMANRDIDPADLDDLDEAALVGRQRVRELLGLAEDSYDLSARQLIAERKARLLD